MLGSSHLRAEEFSAEVNKPGGIGGEVKSLIDRSNSKLPGIKNGKYFFWRTQPVYFSKNSEAYSANNEFFTNGCASPVWLLENQAIMEFLTRIKPKLPIIANYCDGEFFFLLKLMYKEDEDNNRPPYPFYSSNLIKMLGEMGLGIDSDTAFA